MATTRIMPLHVGKGRTESRAISDIIDYVANPKKTDDGRLITGYACDSRTVDAEFLLAKRQYIAATGRVRGADDVIAYHVRQSFRPGEITPEEANRLGATTVTPRGCLPQPRCSRRPETLPVPLCSSSSLGKKAGPVRTR